MRESLYSQIIIWVNNTLYRIGSRVIVPRWEGSCMIYRPEWYKKNVVEYPHPIGTKVCEILSIDSRVVFKMMKIPN